MARKKKSAETKTSKTETSVDAEDVAQIQSEDAAVAEDALESTAADTIEDAEIIEENAPQDGGSENAEIESDNTDMSETKDETASDMSTEPEGEADLLAEPMPEPIAHTKETVVRKGGFFPMALGGIVAAAVGFGAGSYPDSWPWPGEDENALAQEVAAKLEAQAEEIAAVKSAIPETPDLGPIEGKLTGLSQSIATLATDLGTATEQLGVLDQRMTDLEKRPITDGASPTAVAAYERELKALQDAMAAQRAEIEKIAAEAAQSEANAEISAQEAMKRAAISQIQTALDTGAGFEDAVGSLAAVGVTLSPALLQVAENGVASQSELTADFPEVARAALKVARKADGGGGFGGFLKTQLGARSLEPKEGDDPDAVLSRAEAAVAEGRTRDALAEIEGLPEEARAEMTQWLARATARIEALTAAEALAAELN